MFKLYINIIIKIYIHFRVYQFLLIAKFDRLQRQHCPSYSHLHRGYDFAPNENI